MSQHLADTHDTVCEHCGSDFPYMAPSDSEQTYCQVCEAELKALEEDLDPQLRAQYEVRW